MNNILIDSNIWIYAYDADSIFHSKSVSIIQNPDISLYISPKQISEFIAVLTKLNEPIGEIIDFLQSNIINNSTILFPDELSTKQFTDLCRKYNPHGNRVFDIEIVAIAISNQIQEIATFNVKDFKNIDEIQILQKCLL